MNRSGISSIAVVAFAIIFAISSLFGLNSLKTNPELTLTLTVTPSPVPTNIPTSTPTPFPTATPFPTKVPVPTLPIHTGPPTSGLTTITVKTEVGIFSATVLSLDLSQVRVITDTANDTDCDTSCHTLSLSNFVAKNGGFAGINGTYFCPATYSDCTTKTNSFDFPVYNSRLNHWINGDNLSWDQRRAIFYVDGSGAHYQNNSSGFSGGLTAGIINYPGLVDGGNVQIDDNQSGLSDKQKSVSAKAGIGLRDSTHIMVVVAQNVNMHQFAYVFKALGATGALNLDTGGSLALVTNGRYIYGPGRELPNAIIFATK